MNPSNKLIIILQFMVVIRPLAFLAPGLTPWRHAMPQLRSFGMYDQHADI